MAVYTMHKGDEKKQTYKLFWEWTTPVFKELESCHFKMKMKYIAFFMLNKKKIILSSDQSISYMFVSKMIEND